MSEVFIDVRIFFCSLWSGFLTVRISEKLHLHSLNYSLKIFQHKKRFEDFLIALQKKGLFLIYASFLLILRSVSFSNSVHDSFCCGVSSRFCFCLYPYTFSVTPFFYIILQCFFGQDVRILCSFTKPTFTQDMCDFAETYMHEWKCSI